MGPQTKGSVLEDIAKEFDHVYIQYYNNYCYPGCGSVFNTNIQQWLAYAERVRESRERGPLIYVGLPADLKASSNDTYYQSIETVKKIYNEARI